MTIKSEDVRGTGDSRPTKVVKKPITKKQPVSSKAELEDAIKKYQESLKEVADGKVLMKMERENLTFISDGGVKFTRKSPYQLVEEWEVEYLLKQNFRRAYPEEVEEYYKQQSVG